MDTVQSFHHTCLTANPHDIDALLSKQGNAQILRRLLSSLSGVDGLASSLKASTLPEPIKKVAEYLSSEEAKVHVVDLTLHAKSAEASLRERVGYRKISSTSEFPLLSALSTEDPKAAIAELISSIYGDSTSLVRSVAALILNSSHSLVSELTKPDSVEQALNAYTHLSVLGFDGLRFRLQEALVLCILALTAGGHFQVSSLVRIVSTLSRTMPFDKDNLEISRSIYTIASLAISTALLKVKIPGDSSTIQSCMFDLNDNLSNSAPSFSLPVSVWSAVSANKLQVCLQSCKASSSAAETFTPRRRAFCLNIIRNVS
jgi:hypothetical protein